MKKITTYLLLIFVLSTMLFAGCSSQPSAGGDAAESDTIKIGWIGSLTGDQAVWGTCEFDTLKMVVEDANAAGGLLGKQIEVIGYDTRGDATEAVNAVKKGNFDYYVGACNTGGGGALAMEMALLGMDFCKTISMPGRIFPDDEIIKAVNEGKKAFGFVDQHTEKVLPVLLNAILNKREKEN